jgi:hypothetical protein
LVRANHTRLNPQFTAAAAAAASSANASDRDDCFWTTDEERKLVTSMKMYKDNANQASKHFPNRAAASIPSKWNRNFCPLFTRQPFTKEEDDAILHAFRTTTTTTTTMTNNNTVPKEDDDNEAETESASASSSKSFVDIARANFPHRHAQHIYNRWGELASREDMRERVHQGVLSGGVKRSKDALLRPEDFVLQIDNESSLAANKQPL